MTKISREEWNFYNRELRTKRTEKKIEASKAVAREVGFPDGIAYTKPFYKAENSGYGYQGVISCDVKTGEIQCHICGGWFHWLQNHITSYHKIKANEYRETYGLGYQTPLCSEMVRDQLVKRALLFPEERLRKRGKILAKMSKQGMAGTKHDKKKGSQTLEYQNKKGTCALQLFERMEKITKELGRIPYTHEMKGMRTAIRNRYGSVNKMRELLELKGYKYDDSHKKQLSDEQLLHSMRKFSELYKRKPTYSDAKKGLLYGASTFERRFGSWKQAKLLAFGE